MRAITTLLIALSATFACAQDTEGTAAIDSGFTATTNAPITITPGDDANCYNHVRKSINSGANPRPGTVRVAELINYFDYKYPQPTGDAALAINTELTVCPWNKDHKLLRVGLQARKTNAAMLPASNIVLLINISPKTGSSRQQALVAGIKKMVSVLRAKDKVAMVTYGSVDGVLLPATSGLKKDVILGALDKLNTGSATAGSKSVALAYKIAQDNFIKEGNNRIVLITDGDIDPGAGNDGELESLIIQKQAAGIYLSCLSLDTGSHTTSKALASKGRGNYKYLEDTKAAEQAISAELYGTQLVVAKEVAAQIHFNPARAAAYRVIGYQKAGQDENKTKPTAGTGAMNAGRMATILFEIIPPNAENGITKPGSNRELATIRCTFKKQTDDKPTEITHIIQDRTVQWDHASEHTRFAAAVAIYGMLLSDSKYAYNTCFEDAMKYARGAMDYDEDGYREEFVKLVRRAKNNDINAHPIK